MASSRRLERLEGKVDNNKKNATETIRQDAETNRWMCDARMMKKRDRRWGAAQARMHDSAQYVHPKIIGVIITAAFLVSIIFLKLSTLETVPGTSAVFSPNSLKFPLMRCTVELASSTIGGFYWDCCSKTGFQAPLP